ncbi:MULTISPECIES: hypothetical protein [unclassified Streptomyces]|uniref:hypothetical protein n=1 Tax=unclassified Streptomyces TaxID=2593676 RepID=UPI001BE76E58|nr:MULTISPECIES: hypothetical protein [unclassified Streptomyces]MBT2402248.1 hypothetical protein [Streptomyces sp. ISL-21]MBT2456409.1 hypothetical protein [Streptomyces sp. ISL-86]MBT2606805.1 hypothetical protein [Streptomyces sp. ISL-87]
MADTTADTAGTEDTAGAAAKKQDRTAAKLARQIGAFAKEHGGVEGQLAHIGQSGTRIVLVGTDGAWGDLVAPTYATAQLAAEKAGLTLHEDFDGDLAARVRTGPYEWTRMAGIQLGGTANPAA